MRKIIVPIIILLAIGLAGYFVFTLNSKVINNKVSDGINAIPDSPVAILRVTDPIKKWGKLLHSPYGQQLSKMEELSHIDKSISNFQEIIEKNPVFKESYDSKEMYISMHMTGVKSYNILAIGTGSADNKTRFIQALSKELKATNQSKKTYQETEITRINYNGGESNLSVAFKNNLILLSTSSVLLENSLLQLTQGISLNKRKEFAKLFKTADHALDANLFVNYSEVGKWLSVFSTPKQNPSKKFKHFGNWMEVDLKLDDEGLMFNGFSFIKDSSASFLANLKDLSPGKLEVASVIPDNIAFLSYLGFEDHEKLNENLLNHLQEKQELYKHEKNIAAINKNHKINIEDDLYSWIGDEYCFFLTQGEQENPMQNACVAIHSDNIELAVEKLHDIESKSTTSHDSIAFMGHKINNLGLVNFLPLTLGEFFKGAKHTYYTILQDYIVFGNDVGNLKNVINSYLRGKTLIKNRDFNQFYENFSSQSSYFVYLNLKKSTNFWSYFFEEKTAEFFNNNQEVLNDFEALGFQSVSNSNLFYTNIYSNYKVIKDEKQVSLIECVLDTTYTTKPWIVKNHYTQEKEILLQDDKNTLYLINNVGKILWKKKMSQKIIGDVHLVDRYRNKKYQYLFGTKKSLQLIDRNGNSVSGYPVKLKKDLTQGIAVLDYDHNRKYRILVPCGKKLYNYSEDGKIVKGWTFGSSKANIANTPELLQSKKKDYIVFSDVNGNVYTLNRKGESRILFNNKLPKARGNYEILVQSNLKNSGVLTTDTNGTIYYLKLSDDLETITTRAFSKNHEFKLSNFSNTSTPDAVYFDEQEIYIYKLSKNNVLKIEDIDFDPADGVHTYAIDNKGTFIVTATDAESNKIYAYDPSGQVMESFPMEGNSEVLITDINGDEHHELIIGTKQGSLFIYSIF